MMLSGKRENQGMDVDRCKGEEFAILYQLLREDLTERVLFVQRPEGKEGEMTEVSDGNSVSPSRNSMHKGRARPYFTNLKTIMRLVGWH